MTFLHLYFNQLVTEQTRLAVTFALITKSAAPWRWLKARLTSALWQKAPIGKINSELWTPKLAGLFFFYRNDTYIEHSLVKAFKRSLKCEESAGICYWYYNIHVKTASDNVVKATKINVLWFFWFCTILHNMLFFNSWIFSPLFDASFKSCLICTKVQNHHVNHRQSDMAHSRTYQTNQMGVIQ